MTAAEQIPRVAPGGRADVGTIGWMISGVSGRVAGTAAPNLFLTLGRHRKLFRAWLRFAGRLMPGVRLPRRETEFVFLRLAYRRACTYEFQHHVRLGRRAGVDHRDVARVIDGPSAADWSDRERVVLETADQLHRQRDIDDVTWKELRDHLSDEDAVELCMLVGHYEMLATTINALRIQSDRDRRARRVSPLGASVD